MLRRANAALLKLLRQRGADQPEREARARWGTAPIRRVLSSGALLASLFSSERALGQASADPAARAAAYIAYHEPGSAALLDPLRFAERLQDLSPEAVKAKALGYAALRDEVLDIRLFPDSREQLAVALDLAAALERRRILHAELWRARSSPYIFAEEATRIAEAAFRPGMVRRDREDLLAARARQLPYLLDVSEEAGAYPVFLTDAALSLSGKLQRWIAERLSEAERLPESGRAWAHRDALREAEASLARQRSRWNRESVARAAGIADSGDAIAILARSYGFDGEFHLLEAVQKAARTPLRDPAAPSSRARMLSDAVRAALGSRQDRYDVLGLTGAGLFPGPVPSVFLHPTLPPAERRGRLDEVAVGRSRTLLTVFAGGEWDSTEVVLGTLEELSLREDLAEALSQVRARRAPETEPIDRLRTLVAMEVLGPALSWARRAGGGARGAASARLRQGAALEARAALAALLVYAGEEDERALEARAKLLAKEHASLPEAEVRARQLIARALTDPSRILHVALGERLLSLWAARERPSWPDLLAEMMGAQGR